jgi:hypothetical protein
LSQSNQLPYPRAFQVTESEGKDQNSFSACRQSEVE